MKVIVFGVIGDDVHVVANRLMEIGLKENGFFPVNIGTSNQLDDFVEAALETSADAVLVSSINGEGEQWCYGIRERFRQAGLPNVLLYAGGNLVVGDRDRDQVITQFKDFGFNRVFYKERDLNAAFRALSEDLHGHT